MVKKKIAKYEDLDIKVLFEGMKQAYKNAEDYCYEADLLYRIRSYGHSLALSILGLEELSKSYALKLLWVEKIIPGFISKYKSLEPNKLLKDILRMHRKKQDMAIGFAWMSKTFFQEIFQIIQEKPPDDSAEDIVDWLITLQKYLKKKLTEGIKHTKRWEREQDYLKEIEELKEKGMYTDINPENIEIISPNQIKAKEAKKCLDILEKYLDYGDYLPNIQWEENIYSDIKNPKIDPNILLKKIDKR